MHQRHIFFIMVLFFVESQDLFAVRETNISPEWVFGNSLADKNGKKIVLDDLYKPYLQSKILKSVRNELSYFKNMFLVFKIAFLAIVKPEIWTESSFRHFSSEKQPKIVLGDLRCFIFSLGFLKVSEMDSLWLKTPKTTFYLFNLAQGETNMAKTSFGAFTKFMGHF